MIENLASEIIAGIVTLIVAGVTWLFSRVYNCYKAMRKDYQKLKNRVDTLFTWAFGRKQDDSDDGISDDIDDLADATSQKYERLDSRISSLEESDDDD